jgi:zona occludens toxin
MAINSYVGLPGSGKSYGVVEYVVMAALADNRRIWTNIPLNLQTLSVAFPDAPQPVVFKSEQITDDPEFFQQTFEAGATIIIDEAWRFWPAGLKPNNMLEGHKSFFAEHRHMVGADGESTEIIIVTQDLSQICTTIRNLTETTYRAVKLVAIGSNKKYRIDIYQGAVTGPNPPEKLRVRQLFGSYKPNIYQHYQSQTMSDAKGHVKEKTADKRINILNSKWLLIGAPVLVTLMGLMIYNGSKDVLDMYGPKDPEPEIVEAVDGSQPSRVIQEVPKVDRHMTTMDDFIQKTHIYISSNNGVFPFMEYRLQFTNDDQDVSTLTMIEIRQLGLVFTPINSCLVKISSDYSDRLVMCQEPSQPIESETIQSTEPPDTFGDISGSLASGD